MPFRKAVSIIMLAAATLASTACEEPLTSTGPESSTPPGTVATPGKQHDDLFAKMMPAYETAAEKAIKKAGKADVYSDWRALHPEWYAITEPPPEKVRTMREWEPMSILLTGYPDYMPSDPPVRKTMIEMLVHTVQAADTDVGIVVESAAAKSDVVAGLTELGLTAQQLEERVHFYDIPLETIWFIDYGPLPVVSGDNKVGFADMRYYFNRVLDDAVPTRLTQYPKKEGMPTLDATVFRMPFSMEGGNFQGDGEGTCYSTDRALLVTGTTQKEMFDSTHLYAGCDKLVFLKDITDDGTGHIDMFFKLADKDLAILGYYNLAYVNDGMNAQRMDDNEAMLEALALPGGATMKVARLPMPGKHQGTPRTFINSTLVNNVNLWPTYTDDGAEGVLEQEAIQVWKDAMPDYEHIPIISDQIALYSGAIHCVSRTIPKLPVEPIIADGKCVEGKCQGGANAYDGWCQTDEVCKGSKWLCACDDCSASCNDKVCGDVPAAGYCAGDTVVSCGMTTMEQCGANGKCTMVDVPGVVEEACTTCCLFDSTQDKAVCAKDAAECASCVDECLDDSRGCDGDTHAWTCQSVDGCNRRVYEACGDLVCNAGVCGGCGTVGPEGCCAADGGIAYLCGAVGTTEIKCPSSTRCGWDDGKGKYTCLNQSKDPGPEPSGAHPYECAPPCEDECADDDGGCTEDGTGIWSCQEGSQGCLVKHVQACGGAEVCEDGMCVAEPAGDDAGAQPQADAGTTEDTGSAAPQPDTAASTDSGTAVGGNDTSPADGGAAAPGGDSGGCSAASHGGGGAPAALALVLLVGLVARRRRQHA